MKSLLSISLALLVLSPSVASQAEASHDEALAQLALQWAAEAVPSKKARDEAGVIELVFSDGLSEVKLRIRGVIEAVEGRTPETQASKLGSRMSWKNPHNRSRLTLSQSHARTAGPSAPTKPKARLGVFLDEVPESLAHQLGVDPEHSMMISSVNEGGAAEAAGLEKFDVIVKVGESEGASREKLREVLAEKSPGDALDVSVMRCGDLRSCEVTLEAKPNVPDAPLTAANLYPNGVYFLGTEHPLTAKDRQGSDATTLPNGVNPSGHWALNDSYKRYFTPSDGSGDLAAHLKRVEERLARIEAMLQEDQSGR